MKVIENVTLYKCDYCNKKYQRQGSCETHEDMCSKNPENYMVCIDCKFIEKRTMNYNRMPCLINGEQESEAYIEAFWCIKKGHWLYPQTKVSNPIDQSDIEGEVKNEPMPNECDMYESNLF